MENPRQTRPDSLKRKAVIRAHDPDDILCYQSNIERPDVIVIDSDSDRDIGELPRSPRNTVSSRYIKRKCAEDLKANIPVPPVILERNSSNENDRVFTEVPCESISDLLRRSGDISAATRESFADTVPLSNEGDSNNDKPKLGILSGMAEIRRLVRKRKKDFNEAKRIDGEQVEEFSEPTYSNERPKSSPELKKQFSTFDAIESYMSIKFGREKKEAWMQVADSLPIASSQTVNQPAEPVLPVAKTVKQRLSCLPPLSAPTINLPTAPRSFIVSSCFLHQRKLFRRVQQLFPLAEFIMRDFAVDQHLSLNAGLTRIETRHSYAGEADMILAPGTGLLLTTFLMIKQRSLPGQSTHSPIQQRILLALPRYERLIILVSEVRPVSHSASSASLLEKPSCHSDDEALLDIRAFCRTLSPPPEILFAVGGEEQMAWWIVSQMIQHSLSYSRPVSPLRQEETTSELGLRRAGMNAYGAQVILAEIEALQDGRWDEVLGLTVFMEMSVIERIRMFEGLFGGRRLLGRVGAVLDAGW